MKKNWAWIFLVICIAVGAVSGVVLGMNRKSDDNTVEKQPTISVEGSAEQADAEDTGSAEIPDETTSEDKEVMETESVADKKIVSPSSEDDIAEAMNDAAHFAWDWYWDNQYYDAGKSIRENGITFCPITKSGITSQADLKKLTQQYFTSDVTDEMMTYRDWTEKNGTLYTSETEGLGGPFSDYKIQIEKKSDTLYSIEVNQYIEGEYDGPYTMQYKLENGNWVFDEILAWPSSVPVQIDIIDADKTEESNTDDTQSVYSNTDSSLEDFVTSECWMIDGDIAVFRFLSDGKIYAWGDETPSFNARRSHAESGENGRVVGSYTLNGNTLELSFDGGVSYQYEYDETTGKFNSVDTDEELYIAE